MTDRRPSYGENGIVSVPQDADTREERERQTAAYMSRFRNPRGIETDHVAKELEGSNPDMD